MKKLILLFSMLLPFFVFSQNITGITPTSAAQGQTLALTISGNNMSFGGWSCWSQTGNLSDFKFNQPSTGATMTGIPINSSPTQLDGNLIVPAFQPTGVYDLEVLDGNTCTWVLWPFAFSIYAPTWDCISAGNCQDPGTGGGTYASLAACQSACPVVTPTWDCDGQGNCSDPGTGLGPYTSLAACQNNCIAPTWNCDAGSCVNPGDGTGQYSTAGACQSACNIIDSWHCDGQGTCYDPGTGAGIYASFAACDFNCANPQGPSWDCDGQGNCYDPGTGLGPYTTYGDCEVACDNTSINEEISDLLIYPNPAKNTLTIDGDYTSIAIYNVVGKVVLTTDYQNTINVADLNNGIYFIQINTKNASTVKKITIAK